MLFSNTSSEQYYYIQNKDDFKYDFIQHNVINTGVIGRWEERPYDLDKENAKDEIEDEHDEEEDEDKVDEEIKEDDVG